MTLSHWSRASVTQLLIPAVTIRPSPPYVLAMGWLAAAANFPFLHLLQLQELTTLQAWYIHCCIGCMVVLQPFVNTFNHIHPPTCAYYYYVTCVHSFCYKYVGRSTINRITIRLHIMSVMKASHFCSHCYKDSPSMPTHDASIDMQLQSQGCQAHD